MICSFCLSPNGYLRLNLNALIDDFEFLPGCVDNVAQFFSRFKMRYMLFGKRYGFAGFGISAQSRRAMVQGEAAKPANFDPFSTCQRVAQVVHHASYGQFNVFKRKMRLFAGQHLYQF